VINTAFVPMADFDIKHLRKDITMMERVLSCANSSRKKGQELQDESKLDKKFKYIRYIAKKKRDIRIKLAPSMFKRHTFNKSYYDKDEDKFYWTLEVIFVMNS
jgi:hypothetical protein